MFYNRFMTKSILSIILLFCGSILFSQEMSAGFTMLEKGAFEEANVFFKHILSDYPNNKTARICQARAIGLSENPQEAVRLFIELATDYPDDLEIDLNLAESYMWSKLPEKAQKKYASILVDHPDNFTANLGYANALSASNRTFEAAKVIETALDIDPQNRNALISRKFILLKLAYESRLASHFELAERVLKQLDDWYPEDAQIIQNLAELYLVKKDYNKAEKYYTRLQKIAPFEGHTGRAYLQSLALNHKAGIIQADSALLYAPKLEDIPNAAMMKAQMLAQQGKSKQAISYANTLYNTYPNTTNSQLLKARLGLILKEENASLALLKDLDTKMPETFDIKMALVDAYRSTKNPAAALDQINEALLIDGNNQDVVDLQKALKANFQTDVLIDAYVSEDGGGFFARGLSLGAERYLHNKHRAKVQYKARYTNQSENNVPAIQQAIGFFDQWYFSQKSNLAMGVELYSSSPVEGPNISFLPSLTWEQRIAKYHFLSPSFKRSIMDYNADLIIARIILNRIGLNYGYVHPGHIGIYIASEYASINDDNHRRLIYTAVYKDIVNKPLVRLGVNYNYYSYETQRPQFYFSPASFHSVGGFVEINNIDLTTKGLIYKATVGSGAQWIEDDNIQLTRRIEVSFGYKFNASSSILLAYQNNNAAQATNSGAYEFQIASLKAQINIQ